MSTPKLVDLGIKRKEMYASEKPATPMKEKDYDNEMVHPDMHVSVPHAEMLGAADLKKGDRIRQTVEWIVDEHTKREENGKPPNYSMRLKMAKASDCEECEGDDDSPAEEADEGEDESPAMAFISGRAAKE